MEATPEIEKYLKRKMFREKLLYILVLLLITAGILFWGIILNYMVYFDLEDVGPGFKIGLGVLTAILLISLWYIYAYRPPFSTYTYQKLPLSVRRGTLKKVVTIREENDSEGRNRTYKSIDYFFDRQRIQTPPKKINPLMYGSGSREVTILIHPQKPFLITTWSFGEFRILAIDGNKVWT